VPLVFTKFPGCLTGPVSELELASDTTDYEAELVVVIGDETTDVGVDDAWDAVAGLTIGQDVSDRGLQNAGDRPQFSLGKSHRGYGPTGPLILSPDLLPNRDDLAVECTVNGELRQSDRTSNLIFPVAELVSYLSGIVTLQPGDLIFTGTPAGVALPSGNFLRAGDTVVTSIEGLGSLTMTCR
jgi:2-keto-4-pentenoate hydratase/2-oxohepta-3-ene-1,7-dioic acid hydratase in catechol pathway